MTISLYAAIVPSYLQLLGAVGGLLDKAEAYCSQNGIAPEVVIQASLAHDMLPFGFQVKSTVVHSVAAIEAVRTGVFVPDAVPVTDGFAALRHMILDALATLKKVTPEEIDSFEGRDVRFQAGDFRMDFIAEDFLLSFSQPNFYFHATTAYDILRMTGVKLAKIDYLGGLGGLRLKR